MRYAGETEPLIHDPPYRLRREYTLELCVDGVVYHRDPHVGRIDNRTVEITFATSSALI